MNLVLRVNLIVLIVCIKLMISGVVAAADPRVNNNKIHINTDDVEWVIPAETYAGAQFSKAFRYKVLVGEYASVQAENVYFGEAEWAPGAIYVGHKHPSPEIYYIISGEAEWTIDGEVFKASAGTTIYTKPNAVHRMVNIGDEVLKTIWVWWGERAVLDQPINIVEPIEEQPDSAIFHDQ